MADVVVRDGADRRRQRCARRSAATSRSRAGGSSRSATSRARSAERVIEADGPGRLPGLRRSAQPQRLHDPHEPDRAVDDPPGRDDRGRRQLRLHLRAGLGALALVRRGAAADVRLRRPGRVGELRRPPLVPLERRPLAEPRLVRRPQQPAPRRRRVRAAGDRGAARRDGALRRRGDGRGRARPLDRARVQPGPRGADRRDHPPEQGRRPLRRLLHEPRPQPRLAAAGLDRGVPAGSSARAARRARSRTSTCATAPAPRRAPGSARSTRCRRRARSRASTCSPTRRRSATGSARWPGSCRRGCSPTAGRRRASGCATRRCAERLRGECDRYWRFIHKGDWHRVRLQASPQYPGLEGMPFDVAAAQLGTRRRGTPTSRSWPRPGPAIESLLLIGELFTDEHLAEMISHPLFSLGVDGYTASLDAGLDAVVGHPVCFAGHVHYLTHHVGEVGTLPLEEAIRKMTAMPAQHFGLADRGELAAGHGRGPRRARPRPPRRRLDARAPARLRRGRRRGARERRRRSSRPASTPGARPGRHLAGRP